MWVPLVVLVGLVVGFRYVGDFLYLCGLKNEIIMNVKVNDIVRFLNDVGGGRVSRIDGKTVYVEDEDGFERPAMERDLVVV